MRAMHAMERPAQAPRLGRAFSFFAARHARGYRMPCGRGKGLLMPPVNVDPAKVKTFKDAVTFNKWLSVHHDKQDEVWIRIYKVGSGVKSITPKEAIDVCLCWGWIDGLRKSFDDKSFLQRYTPRRKRSIWSQINVDNVTRLIAEGRMTEHGLKEVEAAKADGRWDRAYGGRKTMTIPDDLQAAIDAEPKAKRMLSTLSAQNRFALAFRVHNVKTAGGRKKKIAAFVDMLKRGEAIHPQPLTPSQRKTRPRG
jgi:uncharacterized protein YdeI (YjbR/CyaY-like superfamily)